MVFQGVKEEFFGIFDDGEIEMTGSNHSLESTVVTNLDVAIKIFAGGSAKIVRESVTRNDIV